VESLSERIHGAENELLVGVLREIASGHVLPSHTALRPKS